MHLGRVMGTLVASTVCNGLEGLPLLIVQPLDLSLQAHGEMIVAGDALGTSGPGDLIFFVASREAALALGDSRESFVPVDHAIVGIIDELTPAKEPKT